MRRILILFVDGVGLGLDDADTNPFVAANLPNITTLMSGRKLVSNQQAFSHNNFSFVPVDACMGVDGMPQSATGQASIMTGVNVPAYIGKHWGPKPNEVIRSLLQSDNMLKAICGNNHSVRLANAYPPSFLQQLYSGRRLPSSIQFAFQTTGARFCNIEDLRGGHALAADFTGEGLQSYLGFADIPILALDAAGKRLASLAQETDLLLFDCWQTDVVGHRGTISTAIDTVERLDAVVGGILVSWCETDGLIVIVSDHGNLEDKTTRRHTRNKVPVLLFGDGHSSVANAINDLSDIAPAMIKYLG